jgi:hypothetical protein
VRRTRLVHDHARACSLHQLADLHVPKPEVRAVLIEPGAEHLLSIAFECGQVSEMVDGPP